MKIKPIKTKRVILRGYKKTDKSDLIKNINDKAIARFMSTVPHPYTPKDADTFLNKVLDKKRKDGEINFVFEIEGEFAGGGGIKRDGHQAEIGYWLAKKHWGKGLATEIARELVKFGFGKLKLKRLTAKVFLPNKASARVLEKNGFKLEGILRKDTKKNGKFYDLYLFSKIR
jgi:RimJ/RimL family protein N-acetyltransferase